MKIYWVPQLPLKYIRGNEGLVYDPKLFGRLKKSIEENGFRNPVYGTAVNKMVQIGPGKQRHKAAVELGLDHMPAIVWDYDGSFAFIKEDGVGILELYTPEEIEAHFDDNHTVNRASWERGRLAIQKTFNWRDEQ